MQKFSSIDEFLDFLPEQERQITEYLRDLIYGCIPDVSEKLSYNVPYFKKHKNICFIWPGSVLWGKKRSYEGVRLGFTQGYLLEDEINYLDKGDRKQVYWRDFRSLEEIDSEVLCAYIFEAVVLDKALASQKRKK